jgi:hypothetical protein
LYIEYETIGEYSAPYMKEGRTYVPLRFFSEEVGLDVQWHSDNRTVILRNTIVD